MKRHKLGKRQQAFDAFKALNRSFTPDEARNLLAARGIFTTNQKFNGLIGRLILDNYLTTVMVNGKQRLIVIDSLDL